MRALWYAGGIVLLTGLVAPAAAQQRAVGLRGGVSPTKLEFRPIDTSKLATPLPTLPQPKKPFSFSSLIPSFLKPSPSPSRAPRKLPAPAKPGG
jgi:hypothetical protein